MATTLSTFGLCDSAIAKSIGHCCCSLYPSIPVAIIA